MKPEYTDRVQLEGAKAVLEASVVQKKFFSRAGSKFTEGDTALQILLMDAGVKIAESHLEILEEMEGRLFDWGGSLWMMGYVAGRQAYTDPEYYNERVKTYGEITGKTPEEDVKAFLAWLSEEKRKDRMDSLLSKLGFGPDKAKDMMDSLPPELRPKTKMMPEDGCGLCTVCDELGIEKIPFDPDGPPVTFCSDEAEEEAV